MRHNYVRQHSCEEYDGECESWGWHHPAPLAQWERDLLGLNDGMILTAHRTFGQDPLEFTKVSIDSAKMEGSTLVLERNDEGGSKVEVVYVPNVAYWVTTYR